MSNAILDWIARTRSAQAPADGDDLRPTPEERAILDDVLVTVERVGVFGGSVIGVLGTHPWILVDWLLERPIFWFSLYLRLFIDVLVLPWLIWMKIGRNDRAVATFAAPLFLLSFGLVASVVAQAEHYSLYVLRFSLILWTGGAQLRWSWPRAAVTCALLLGMFWGAHLIWPEPNGGASFVAAMLYLTGVAVLLTVRAAAARRQEEHTLLLALRLERRNDALAGAIAELRTTQARLVEQEKLSALGRLLAGLSHEINNPVNVILHSVESVRRGAHVMIDLLRDLRQRAGELLRPDTVRQTLAEVRTGHAASDLDESVDDIELSGRRLRNIHRELRAFVRGDAQQPAPTDLVPGLAATVAMIKRSSPAEVEWKLSVESLPAVLVNPGQANQIFFNLLQNAVDAVGASGHVEVSAVVDDQRVKILVADDGPGVPAHVTPRIFEPFFTTKPVGKGTGLGLAISRELAQRNGGTVELETGNVFGACFSVTLPRVVEGVAATPGG